LKKISIIRKYPAAMRLTDWSCVVVLALIQLTSSAQPQKNIQFHHFSEEHKLPSHSYSSILQDKKGYIWFGTDWHGLIKYDGYTFKFFNQDPFDLNSLGSPNTRSLCNDIHGNVWIAGEGGVSKYDPHKENFIPYWYDWYGPQHKSEISHQSEYIAALPTSTITCVVGDEMGRLWIGTAKGLCFLILPQQKL
jgi:ligand-binding sensor domain-containing protein